VSGYTATLPRRWAGGIRRLGRVHLQPLAVTVALAAVAGALFVVTLTVGSTDLAPGEVVASLLGLSPDQGVDFIVWELRLPIAASALCVGIALGVSGTLLQRLLGNPLAAPELIGISAGASLAAVTGIVLLSWSGFAISLAALVGALGAALLIYALAWRGGVSGSRLVLIGIGISELTLALVAYLVARANLNDARAATHWLAGSIGQAGTGELRALAIALLALVPLALALNRPLRALELGDDPARALGARVELARLGLVATAVSLAGLATAVAGPIAFVALVAGPIAQRIAGPGRAGILAAGFVGATIVLASDLVAQQVLPVALPTGVVTGAVGAPYLLAVLFVMNRKGARG
jgi:iron complex transport system permease protein